MILNLYEIVELYDVNLCYVILIVEVINLIYLSTGLNFKKFIVLLKCFFAT